jgi:CheY-like chemotaxis protein
LVQDLFVSTRIQETARQLGVPLDLAAPDPSAAGLAASLRPDVVIIGLEEPGDPLGAIRELKASDATRGVPIVGFCSHVNAELAQQARAAGCNLVLPRSAFTVRLAEVLRGAPGT